MKSIVLPGTITDIGTAAFQRCSALEEIRLPDDIEEISADTFNGCTSLQSAELPGGLKRIGWRAFQECTDLMNIALPEGTVYIGDYAFSECSGLRSMTCQTPLQSWEAAFFHSAIVCGTSDTPWNYQYSQSAFLGCGSLIEIDISDGTTNIGDSAFQAVAALLASLCRKAC